MTKIERVSPGHLRVSGELNFDSVVMLREKGAALLKEADSKCEIDLSGVTRAGSAGVSLLLSWLRCAAAREIELVYSHLPADLLGVARVSGIDQFLPTVSQ